jgi:hypothetical protein
MRNTNVSGGAARGLPHLLHCTIHLIQPPDHALLRVNYTFEILFLLLSAQGPGAAISPSMTMSLPHDRS